MKQIVLIIAVCILGIYTNAQTKITNVLTNDAWTSGATSYSVNGITYNWAMNPNNITKKMLGFSTANANFDKENAVVGQVKLRRKDNAAIAGNYSLVFNEGISYGNVNSMATAMPSTMESFFNDNAFNKGAENLFDNTGSNKNNVERFDWIVNAGYASTQTNKEGFIVVQKGNEGDYLPLGMAAITAIDAQGNPISYGPLKKINASDWENIFNSSFSNRITKAQEGSSLTTGGGGIHNRAGVYVTLQDLGIGNNVIVYGYSLFADDIPMNTTSTDMLAITNDALFPKNSCCYCGLDLVAVTGLFKEVNTLPVYIQEFSGYKIDDNTNSVFFKTSNYPSEIAKLELLKSNDGTKFENCKTFTTNFLNQYTFEDKKLSGTMKHYYRIKITRNDGYVIISNILRIENTRGAKPFQLVTNPVRNNLAFAYTATQKGKLQATIIDGFGKIISTNSVNTPQGTSVVEINATSTLANGIYFLQVYKEGELKETIRFMKQ